MQNLIDSVATLIDMRDRDDLEFTLASVMLDLLRASALVFWSIAPHKGGAIAHERVYISVNDEIGEAEGDWAPDLPVDKMSPEARAAFAERRPVTGSYQDDALGRHAFPLLHGNEIVGLVEIAARPPLDAEQQRMAMGLIRIYRSHLGILESTDTDELTGLYNRRPFDEMFRRFSNNEPSFANGVRPRRTSRSLARTELAVADIDLFKRVNDTFGHPYGDEVLVLISRLMRETLRDTDRLFRFGGEEFVILLANVDAVAAERALERLRLAIARFEFPQVGHVTVSLGVTTVRPGETGSDAFGRADAALYFAKGRGRNRLLRYETLVEEGAIAPKPDVVNDVEMF